MNLRLAGLCHDKTLHTTNKTKFFRLTEWLTGSRPLILLPNI
jgi:hypothetical protein